MPRRLLSFGLSVIVVTVLAASALGQQCPAPPDLAHSNRQANFFNESQEAALGDIFASKIAQDLHVIEDEAIAGYVQRIGDRLLKQMPPSELRFRFYVVDSPESNAFAIAGGRVYVTRKLIVTVKSEDELAGVIGHELGHQLAHHSAIQWTRIFKDMLNVTAVGDRADIEEKYHQFLDTYHTKMGALRDFDPEKEQLGADRVAVYGVARAGYKPEAVVEFWDRFTESKGRKGSWISDFLGSTKPETKRLREFANTVGKLPAGCVAAGELPKPDEFLRWQAAVRDYNGFGKKEDVHSVVVKRKLAPELRPDVERLRFSPDGKYVLAQDEASIYVLTRDPLASILRIDAINAENASFSPDSQYVTFRTNGLRVERWNVAGKRLEDVRELYVFGGCVQQALSPDGAFLACLRGKDFPLDLVLYDTATSTEAVTKKDFFRIDEYNAYIWLAEGMAVPVPPIAMNFSPDGRYFVAGRGNSHLLVDLKSKTEIPMSGALKKFTSTSFAFVGADKIVGTEGDLVKGALVAVPSGDTLSADLPIGGRTVWPVTKGDYVIVRPMQKAPMGVMDLKAKKIFMANKAEAFDMYEGAFVAERVNGELAVYPTPGQPPSATVTLPQARLASVATASVAPDLKSAAISNRMRGAIWDLNSGDRIFYVRGFRGAFYGADGLYIDFAPADQFRALPVEGEKVKDVRVREGLKPGHSIARADLGSRAVAEVSAFQKRQGVEHAGSVVLTVTPEDDEHPKKAVVVEAHDMHNGEKLWSRRFSHYNFFMSGNSLEDIAVLTWDLGSRNAKEELKSDPEAKRLVDSLKETEGAYLVEVINSRTGKPLGKFPIETGRLSFHLNAISAGAGMVVAVDNNERVLLYSYAGEKKGRTFGTHVAFSPDGKLLCVQSEPGRLSLYDIGSLQKERDRFTFGGRVIHADFPDAKHLAVVTQDETIYVLDVSAPSPTRSAGTK